MRWTSWLPKLRNRCLCGVELDIGLPQPAWLNSVFSWVSLNRLLNFELSALLGRRCLRHIQLGISQGQSQAGSLAANHFRGFCH
jgi:hypothetical protein